jgi:hypothetical protein
MLLWSIFATVSNIFFIDKMFKYCTPPSFRGGGGHERLYMCFSVFALVSIRMNLCSDPDPGRQINAYPDPHSRCQRLPSYIMLFFYNSAFSLYRNARRKVPYTILKTSVRMEVKKSGRAKLMLIQIWFLNTSVADPAVPF